MALTIYGTARSRTMRVLWLVRELGLEFEHVPMASDDPNLKSADFLALNPAGTIPTIVDDGFPLCESLAITAYLAKRYGDGAEPMYPQDARGEALLWQWSLWAQGHLEPWIQQDRALETAIAAMRGHQREIISRSLNTLDRALTRRSWLISGHFTVADLNVAAVLSPSRAKALDLSAHNAVRRWLSACYSRPACERARAEFLDTAPP